MKARTVSAAALFVLGVTLTTVGPARAGEEDATPRPRPQSSDEITQKRVALRLQGLAKKLDLTEEQKKTLRPIFEAEANELRALRMNTSISPEEQQAEIRSLHERYRPKLQAVLTPEQREKLVGLKQEARVKLDESAGQKKKGRVPVAPDVD